MRVNSPTVLCMCCYDGLQCHGNRWLNGQKISNKKPIHLHRSRGIKRKRIDDSNGKTIHWKTISGHGICRGHTEWTQWRKKQFLFVRISPKRKKKEIMVFDFVNDMFQVRIRYVSFLQALFLGCLFIYC